MEVFLIFPKSKQARQELGQELAKFQSGQVLKNVRVDDKAAAQADPAVQKAIAEVAAQLGSTGRILVRESGTEPVIRVMVEAESKPLCQELVDRVVGVIQSTGHAV